MYRIWVCILVSIGLIGYICLTTTAREPSRYRNIVNIRTIEFEGCEYVVTGYSGTTTTMIHKGNCKYCLKLDRDK